MKEQLLQRWEHWRQRVQLPSLYSPDADDLDVQHHLSEAMEWLKRAQDAGNDRGVSYGVFFGQDFDVSYPETTGYICQTFVEQEQLTGDTDLLERAVAMGDWEIAVQLSDGAVMGGKLGFEVTPAVFNTGMVLLGWSALIRRTGIDRFRHAARRASEWLISMQEPDGRWIRGNSMFAAPGSTLYNVKAAWGLCEAGVALGEESFIQAALRNAEYCLSRQRPNGWLPDCCLADPLAPLLHTLAYSMQGLIGIGKLTGRNDLIAGAQRLADAQLRIMHADGFIAGQQRADFSPAVSWCCLTGSAQTSAVWSELFLLTHQEKYRAAVRTVNRYLIARHDIRNPDLRLRGGVPGSWPVWGDYGRLRILNWATKFLVDALSLEQKNLEVMGTRFIALTAEQSSVAELAALLPTNPFATWGFFETKRQMGCAAWMLGLRDDAGALECGCGGFIKTGRLERSLEIQSLPAVIADSSFWDGLREFCRHHGVTKLELGTAGSNAGVEIPSLGTDCVRVSRCEFVLDLAGDLASMLSPSHKKNVKRAQKAGIVLRRSRSAEAANAQLSLMDHSIDRRRSRGENVTPGGSSPALMAFLQTGAGELFQAVRNDTVLSGVLVLRSARGAYSYYAGTSAEGMKVSASHFLNYCIATQLRAEGAHTYNLGGRTRGSSLASFKEGFGARQVPLPSASCYIGPAWRRRAGRVIAQIRSSSDNLRQRIADRTSRMIVYAVDTNAAPPPEAQAGLEFRALTTEHLRHLSAPDDSFRVRQLERVTRFDASYAYAVFADGQIAHMSWLLPPTAMEKDPPRVLRVRPRHAEITGCETLPAFRGRGIYGFAIRNLVQVAREQGVRRVFMKTSSENTASQSGIQKAGLQRVGSAILIVLPVIERLVVWRRFR